MQHLVHLFLIAALLIVLQGICFAENVALGKPVSFDPQPNYYLCTDPEDAIQITDGKRAPVGFWRDISCVGWSAHSQCHIKIDLQSIQPISKVVFSTAASKSGDVHWPSVLMVHVSDDGINYHYIGDMISTAIRSGNLKPIDETEQRYDFALDNLKIHGRYVVISASTTGSYIFTDEIEVYKGEESFLKETLPGTPDDYKSSILAVNQTLSIIQRLSLDVSQISEKLAVAKIKESDKEMLRAKLAEYNSQISDLQDSESPDGFKAILPINDLEASIFALNGVLMSKLGYQPLTVWKKHRYDKLELLENPSSTKPEISIEAMRNEYRADSFLITNASDKMQTVTMSIFGIPNSRVPASLEISAVPWTDTNRRQPVAVALPEIRSQWGTYKIDVPAGLTVPIWFTLNTSLIESGNYKGTVELVCGDWKQELPINLRVSKLKMGRPRMSLGMWDYTHGSGYGALAPSNIDAAIRMMKSHYVDSPWATPGTLPLHEEMTAESFAAVDRWFGMWPEARHFFVFMHVPNSFTGSPIGTPEFDAKVGKWAKSVDAHLVSRGMDPKIIGLLLLDEPYTDEQDEIIAAWARAIKKSGSQITLFEDTMWQEPEKTKHQDAITLMDILCPMLNIYYGGSQESRDYYENLRRQGKALWFYQCIGPIRGFDPAEYYRLTAWQAFKTGMVGMGFWAFGDTGGAKSCWNEYAVGGGVNYSPVFIDPTSVTDSIHWQAVREGILDYEYLGLLKDAAASSSNAKLKKEAENLLNEAIEKIAVYSSDFSWKPNNYKHQQLDNYRTRILRMLEKMEK